MTQHSIPALSEMSALIRAKDWSKTVLGPSENWPPSLSLVVNLVLASGFPMAVRWGSEFAMIYNDGYAPILGDKHPWALGLPFREVWPEVQATLRPLHEAILSGKRGAFFAEDLLLRIQRHGSVWEDARFTISYSPIPETSSPTGVGGVLITAVETTNRVTTEKALRASEERYRTAMMLGRMGSWEVDFVQGVRVWTPEGMALFGINLSDGLGRVGGETDELHQSIHPEDRHLLAQYHVLANTQDSFPAEYRIVKADGKVSWLSGYGRVLDRQADGKAHRVIHIATDITERKHVEAALGESQQRLRWSASIVESSDDAIISKNLDGIITSWNQGAERVFGYTAEEAVGRHIMLIIPADRRGEETTILERIKRGERVDHFETVRVRKDGKTLDISLTISPVKDGAGRVVGASKVARDVTDEKRIERALRDSEERFRAIVDTTPECVKLVAANGTLLHMNSSGLAMVGADGADKVVGQTIYSLIAPKDRERFQAFNERICRGEKSALEFDIVGLDGTARRMETHAAPLRIPDGTVVQLGVTRDITERTRAEEKLRRSEEKLRALTGELESQVRSRTRELEDRNAEILQQSEQLRDLSRRLLQVQDQERRHIARELHDSAGQIVTVLGMHLSRIGQRAQQNDPKIAEDFNDCQELVHQLSQEIRTTSYLLSPPLLDETGLHQALRWYIEGLTQRS